MAKVPRKHHYVPRSVLSNFTIDDNGQQLYVFDKHRRKSFLASVFDAGAERDFNCVQICGESYNFESLFQCLDDRLAQLISKVCKEASVSLLTEEDKFYVPFIIACQLVRTKLQRTTLVEIGRQLSELIVKLGLQQPQAISDEDARRNAFSQLLQLDKIAIPIQKKDLILLYSSEQRLLISDNPVVINNSLPYGRTGLESPGIEIYYPISSQLCMAFYCYSVREDLEEAIDPHHPRTSPQDPFMVSLHQALLDGGTLNIPPKFAEYLNGLQIYQSSRFLYSSNREFGQIEKAIAESPNVANVKSRYVIGSSVVPPAPNLPIGIWLIAEKGYRHYALSIELLDMDSPFIHFKTTDQQKLTAIEQHCPLDCVTVYINGRGIRGMRKVIFRHIILNGDSFIRAEHDDQSLNAIFS